jgi:hypothetical protein
VAAVVGGGGGVLGGAVVGANVGELPVGAADGAWMAGAGGGAAALGGANGVVEVVRGTVGRMTPVSPNGSRDTTVTAETTTHTAPIARPPRTTAASHGVQYRRSRRWAPSMSPRPSRSASCAPYAIFK